MRCPIQQVRPAATPLQVKAEPILSTLDPLEVWYSPGALDSSDMWNMSWFLASFLPGRGDVVFSRHTLRKRFRTACKTLGPNG